MLAFNVAGPVEGLQVRKKLELALHEWFQGERPKFVLFGPGGAGKSMLAVKFAVAQAERSGLRLVFVLSASSMELDYTGLLGQSPDSVFVELCAPSLRQ
jgi:DNA replication protein DnaC